jgi:hypothetical protein
MWIFTLNCENIWDLPYDLYTEKFTFEIKNASYISTIKITNQYFLISSMSA